MFYSSEKKKKDQISYEIVFRFSYTYQIPGSTLPNDTRQQKCNTVSYNFSYYLKCLLVHNLYFFILISGTSRPAVLNWVCTSDTHEVLQKYISGPYFRHLKSLLDILGIFLLYYVSGLLNAVSQNFSSNFLKLIHPLL